MTQSHHSPEKQQEGPITVSIARKIRKGSESEYEQWEKSVLAEAANFQGYMGTNFLRPNSATDNKYIIIYRFDSYQNACIWEDSEIRQEWLKKVEPFVIGKAEKQKKSGLEVWFELPEIESAKPASRYKMAIVLTVILYLLSLSLNIVFGPVMEHIAPPLKSLIILIVTIVLMTWVIMPKVTYLLRKWLFK